MGGIRWLAVWKEDTVTLAVLGMEGLLLWYDSASDELDQKSGYGMEVLLVGLWDHRTRGLVKVLTDILQVVWEEESNWGASKSRKRYCLF